MGERHMILNSLLKLISLTLQYKQPILNYKTKNYKELNTSQGLCLFLSNSKLCGFIVRTLFQSKE